MDNAYVYIMASGSGCIYTGITNDIIRRVYEHKNKLSPKSFAARYNCTKLVYLERHDSFRAAIDRETEIKGWRREKKTALIAQANPEWDDLSAEYCQ